MYGWSPSELRAQLARGEKAPWWHSLVASAVARSLEPAYVAAIGSRETNLRAMSGDGGHGRGVLQVDDRYHATLPDGTPINDATEAQLIDAGCAILAEYLGALRTRYPEITGDDLLRFAAAAYNAGVGGAERGHMQGDCDLYTTDRDYGRDTLARLQLFREWMR